MRKLALSIVAVLAVLLQRVSRGNYGLSAAKNPDSFANRPNCIRTRVTIVR